MKKFLIALIAVCVVIAVAFGFAGHQEKTTATLPENPVVEMENQEEILIPDPAEEAPAAVPDGETNTEATDPASGRLDYDALYTRYAPDEKVLTIDGQEQSWGDYFYVLYTQSGQIEDYFNTMAAYYGIVIGWSDPVEEASETTFADEALDVTERLTVELAALEKYAEENNVVLSDEVQAKMEAQKQQDIITTCGEGATEEDFAEFLQEIYLSREMYDRIVLQNYLYQESFKAIYGENAENLSDEEALAYLTENKYVAAAHILLETTDKETGEAVSEDDKAVKKAELEAVVKELRAIEDPEARAAAFLEKMNTLSEDPGKERYPEGYTFTTGRMVAEFEDAAFGLKEYEVSDVVETDYGYHILMRLPLSADAVVEYNNSTGEARTGRMLAANEAYSKALQTTAEKMELSWLPGYEKPNLMDYVVE